mmetsp:Transcript_28070/g.58777  ORF Transcript_28070/g.58777 Transcript_28070/m.58777 type:complete len:86 (-) Transcript_28070:2094-2351(-)
MMPQQQEATFPPSMETELDHSWSSSSSFNSSSTNEMSEELHPLDMDLRQSSQLAQLTLQYQKKRQRSVKSFLKKSLSFRHKKNAC